MRERSVRHRLDRLNLEDVQIDEPAVEAKERVVAGTDALGRLWPVLARLNIRHTATPSRAADSTPKPMMRRMKTSMTSITQWLRRRIDFAAE